MCKLTEIQLTVVMHLCNGMTLEEIAVEMNYSLSNVKRHVAAARKSAGARTNVHLASIVIASGQLYWTDDGRTTEVPEQPAPAS